MTDAERIAELERRVLARSSSCNIGARQASGQVILGEEKSILGANVMTEAERIAGLEGQLKAQAGNAAEEARQNAAELGHLRQRIAELESERDRALCARNAHCEKWLDAEKRVTAYQDRAKVAENERDEARVAQAEHNVKRLLAVSRADRAEARLAQAREALRPFADEADSKRIQSLDENELVWIDGDLTAGDFWRAEEIYRALASDTDTGEPNAG